MGRTLMVAALACLVAPALAGRADDQTGPAGVRAVGSIPRPPGCGTDLYAVDGALGVLVDIHQLLGGTGTCPGTARGTFVTTFSIATLKQLTPVVPLTSAHAGAPDVSAAPRPVVDTAHHRLYIATNGPTAAGPLFVYDIRGIAAARGPVVATATYSVPLRPPASAAASGQDQPGTLGDSAVGNLVVNAIAYDASGDSVDLILANPGSVTSTNQPPSSYDVYLDELNGTTGAQHWLVRLGSCVIPVHSAQVNALGAVLHLHGQGGDEIAATCAYVNPLEVADAQSTNVLTGIAATVIVPLSSGSPSGTQLTYLGRTGTLGAFADPATSRVLYATEPATQAGTGANAAGPSLVAFDVLHHAYIGATTASSAAAATTGFAVAVAGARVYAAGPAGIVVADDSATPTDPGLVYPVYTGYAQDLLADAATHRLFVVPESCANGSCTTQFTAVSVFEDDSEILPVTAVDPDTFTHDIAEQPGTTQTTFAGRAFGAALRTRLVGGVTTFLDGVTVDNWSNTMYSCGASRCPGNRVPPDYLTHEVDYGVVTEAALDNVQANATASTVVGDDSTAGTLQQRGGIALPRSAACSAPQTPAQTVAWSPTAFPAGDDIAAVGCALGDEVTATSRVHAVSMDAPSAGTLLAVGAGSVTTSVVRDATDGLVSTTTASVDSVVVGPVRVGSVTSTTVCRAHGRPHTASCTFSRVISGVVADGAVVGPGLCSETDPSATGAQGCQQVIDELNAVRPGLLIFSAPQPDARTGSLQGSPGGYQAIAQREQYEHLQDAVLNYDSSLTVPGLEILDVNDTQSAPSRLDIQLAAVEAESHYGVNPPFGFAPPPQTLPVLPPSGIVAPLPAAGAQPVGGTAPPPAGASPAPASPSGTGLLGAVSRVLDGLALLGRSPGTGILVALLLGLLGAPLLAAWRRGRLLAALAGTAR